MLEDTQNSLVVPDDRDPATIDFLAPTRRDRANYKTIGRPVDYSLATATEILRRISEGETLTAICQDAHMPARSVVYWWMSRVPDFQDAVSHARVAAAGGLVEEALTASRAAVDKDSSMVAKVRSDTCLRVAAMIDPARWSEKRVQNSATQIIIQTNLGGPGDGRKAGEFVVNVPSDGGTG